MLIAYVPLLVALVGLLMWILASNPKVQLIGQWLFIVGIFWAVGATMGRTVKIF